jgi:hypothetical protein
VSVATRLLGDLGPVLNADLESYLRACAQTFEDVDALARDDPPWCGWSVVLDPAACPAAGLPWLAQFVGVELAPGTDEASARAAIAQHAGWRRGTPAAIEAAVKPTLTGSRFAYLDERVGGDAYAAMITTRTDETPDPAATLAAAMAAKPAGILLTQQLVSGTTYDELDGRYATYNAWPAVDYDTIEHP